MANLNLSNTTTSNISDVEYSNRPQSRDSTFKDLFSVSSKSLDNGDTWTPEFDKWHGYYRMIPEFRSAIDKIVTWVFGNGFEESKDLEKTKNIRGAGKDTFLSIMKDALRVCLIPGDSTTEIIRDKKGRLINLKSIDSGTMKFNLKKGMLKNYAQRLKDGKEEIFNLDDIFHLSWNKIASENHGVPLGEALENLMLMRSQNMEDQSIFFHRFVQPIIYIEVDESNTTELTRLKAEHKTAWEKGEVVFVGKDTIGKMRNAMADLPNIDQLPWLKFLIRQFVTGTVPEVVMGWGEGSSEAGSKIIMVGWVHDVKNLQRWIESQIKLQLKLDLKLKDPPDILKELESPGSSDAKVNSLASDDKKDGNSLNVKPGKNTK